MSLISPPPGAARAEGLEPLLLVGALVALGLFGWVVFGVRRAGDGRFGPGLPDRSPQRLRKMTLLWLGLAAALGGGVLRTPVARIWGGGAADLPLVRWLTGIAGLGIVVVALAFFARTLRRPAPAAEEPRDDG